MAWRDRTHCPRCWRRAPPATYSAVSAHCVSDITLGTSVKIRGAGCMTVRIQLWRWLLRPAQRAERVRTTAAQRQMRWMICWPGALMGLFRKCCSQQMPGSAIRTERAVEDRCRFWALRGRLRRDMHCRAPYPSTALHTPRTETDAMSVEFDLLSVAHHTVRKIDPLHRRRWLSLVPFRCLCAGPTLGGRRVPRA